MPALRRTQSGAAVTSSCGCIVLPRQGLAKGNAQRDPQPVVLRRRSVYLCPRFMVAPG